MRGRSFYKFWQLLKDEISREEEPFNLNAYLERFIKKGKEIPFCRARFVFEYSPWPAYSRIYSEKNYGIYLDSFFNIFLTVSKFREGSDLYFPIALVSFDIEEDLDTIVIWQIQGVKGAAEFLRPIQWEKMLVNVVVVWAKKYGFKAVEVANVKELRFYPKKYIEGSMLPLTSQEEEISRRMEFRYSITPKRLGFKFNEKRKRWIKNLQ